MTTFELVDTQRRLFYVSERDLISVKDSIIYDSETGSIGQSLTHKKACLRTDIVPVSPGK